MDGERSLGFCKLLGQNTAKLKPNEIPHGRIAFLFPDYVRMRQVFVSEMSVFSDVDCLLVVVGSGNMAVSDYAADEMHCSGDICQ